MRHRDTWLKLLLLSASVTPASGLADLRLAPRLRRATPRHMAPARLPAARQPRATALMQLAWDPKVLAVSLGGVFAGGLHSVTGPDHLAALLPICIGKRWWLSVYTGFYWGMGHGIGAALVGALAFAVRGALNVDLFSTYMEAAVGISIMVIGLSGIAEAREWSREHVDGPTASNAHHDLDVILETEREQSVPSTLITGVLHGCTGTGHLLGVMPALAMPSWLCASAYLTSFGFGTMVAMSLFTAVVGEASAQLSTRLNQRDLPAKMAMASSIFALVMGSVWTARACAALSLPQLIAKWAGAGLALCGAKRLGVAAAA